jgi:hypothetical protein
MFHVMVSAIARRYPFLFDTVPNTTNHTLSPAESLPVASFTPSIYTQTVTTTVSGMLSSTIASATTTAKSNLGPHPHGDDGLRLRVHVAHGVLAATTIVVLFPSVAIFLRLFRSPNVVRYHYTAQLINTALLLLVFSLGVWLSWLDGWVSELVSIMLVVLTSKLWHWPHQILGTIIVTLFLLQPILGVYQHTQFLKTGVRSVWASAHVWYGRVLIVLGVINGGLGLQLADNASAGEKAVYIVVAIIMFFIYIAAHVWFRMRIRKQAAAQVESAEIAENSAKWENLNKERNPKEII